MVPNLDFTEVFGTPEVVVQPSKAAPSSQVIISRLKQAETQALKQIEPKLAQMAQTVFTDPGFDMSPDDSDLWLHLFVRARNLSFELHAKLFYLRGIGTILVPSEKYGYMIKALIDPEGKKGFTSKEDYGLEKQCLDSYKKEVVSLLQELRCWKDKEESRLAR